MNMRKSFIVPWITLLHYFFTFSIFVNGRTMDSKTINNASSSKNLSFKSSLAPNKLIPYKIIAKSGRNMNKLLILNNVNVMYKINELREEKLVVHPLIVINILSCSNSTTLMPNRNSKFSSVNNFGNKIYNIKDLLLTIITSIINGKNVFKITFYTESINRMWFKITIDDNHLNIIWVSCNYYWIYQNRWKKFKIYDKISFDRDHTTTIKPYVKQLNLLNNLFYHRRKRHDLIKGTCERFECGDNEKSEFYSPNYPSNYPSSVDCYRILEADEGMLIKLDFRDYFELESRVSVNGKETECRFDYLEVRDGRHGFSPLIGFFCDKNFPPEITSKSRYLWLHFHSDDTIEYKGFKAIWSMTPRPTYPGVPPEQEQCVREIIEEAEAEISSSDVEHEKKKSENNGVALDCLWIIRAKEGWKMQLTFDQFKLDKPNDCDANFISVFGDRTDIPSLIKNFCGSIAEPVSTKSNMMFLRYYLEPKAINSTFKSLMTAIREKETSDAPCREDEYDCDDSTCIADHLKCNQNSNCRLGWDEDVSICGKSKGALDLDSTRIIIILVIFSLIIFGMCFVFTFNCIRKLIRDHQVIREHIRQSQQNRLDELGRRSTTLSGSVLRTKQMQVGSTSASPEMDSSGELIPPALVMAVDYVNEFVMEKNCNSGETLDIHQNNNVNNATQERLQGIGDSLVMCDNSCQTRESIFSSNLLENFNYPLDSSSSSPPGEERLSDIQPYNHHHHHDHYHNRHQYLHKHHDPDQNYYCHVSPSERIVDHHQYSLNNKKQMVKNKSLYSNTSKNTSLGISHTTSSRIVPEASYQYTEGNSNINSEESSNSNFIKCEKSKCSYNIVQSLSNLLNSNQDSEQINNKKFGNPGVYSTTDIQQPVDTVMNIDRERPFSIESCKSAPDVIAMH